MSVATSFGYGCSRPTEYDGLYKPKAYRPTGELTGAIWCHGAGRGAEAGFSLASNNLPILRAIGAHLPIIVADLGGPLTWGNDDSIDAVQDAYDLLTGSSSAYGAKPGKVIVAGGSMGTLVGLNWVRQNPTLVAAIAMVLPVLDLNDVHANNRGGLAAGIDAAYGGAYVNATERAEHNPAYWIANGDDLGGAPIHLWYTSNDGLALASIVATFAANAQAAGSEVMTHSLGPLGHSDAAVAALDHDAAVAFILEHA